MPFHSLMHVCPRVWHGMGTQGTLTETGAQPSLQRGVSQTPGLELTPRKEALGPEVGMTGYITGPLTNQQALESAWSFTGSLPDSVLSIRLHGEPAVRRVLLKSPITNHLYGDPMDGSGTLHFPRPQTQGLSQSLWVNST